MQEEGVNIGKIGGNTGKYRGNIGVACAIWKKRNIEISPRYDMIWTPPATKIPRRAFSRIPPEDFCISQNSKILERFF